MFYDCVIDVERDAEIDDETCVSLVVSVHVHGKHCPETRNAYAGDEPEEFPDTSIESVTWIREREPAIEVPSCWWPFSQAEREAIEQEALDTAMDDAGEAAA